MTIHALAEPRDAPHPREALALIDFLLRPTIAAESTGAAGLASAEVEAPTQDFRGLWPVGVYPPTLLPLVEKEWARARAPEKPEPAAQAKPGGKPSAKPKGTKR